MKKKLLLKLLAVFSPILLFSQAIKIEGTIKDQQGNPLEMANVIALKSNNTIESYSITDSKGNYRLTVDPNQTYQLRVSFLGFAPHQETVVVTANSANLTKSIVLLAMDNKLKEVEVTYKIPITIKGDTLTYDKDAFSSGNEKKLGDVLKKLPGVEINSDGEVEVEGKKVQKVMVNGKDFFDGDTKMATKNIPASAIDKIEFLRNYNEVNPMRGVGDDSDNVAMNIRLKKGKENFWFGELSGGVGLEERYLVHPKLFYYSPKRSVNLLFDANNIGAVPFTMQDYFRFTGGMRGINRGGGTTLQISSNDLGFSMTRDNRALEIDTKFGAFNFSYNPIKTWTLSGFSILNDTKTELLTKSLIQTNVTEETTSGALQRSQLGMLKLSSSYKPNLSTHFDYDILIKKSKQTEDNSITSLVSGDPKNIEVGKENNPFSINQNINFYKTMDAKNLYSAEIQHLWQEEQPFYNSLTAVQPFPSILPVQAQSLYDLTQNRSIKTNKLDVKADYFYLLNNTSNINLTAAATISHQNFDSSLFQILDNDTQNLLNNDNLKNDVTYNFTDLYVGLRYKMVSGILTVSPGLTLHQYLMKDTQLGNTIETDDVKLLPDFYAKLQLKKSETMRLTYNMSLEFTDILKRSEGYIFNNYKSMSYGNRALENAIYHRVSLQYFNFNMFSFLNIQGFANYSKKVDGVKNSITRVGINQVSSPINSNLADETISGNFRFSKRFKKIETRLRANVTHSNYFNFEKNAWSESKSFTQNYQGSLVSSFKNAPNFEVGYNRIFNDYNSGNRDTQYITDRPFANVEIGFLKHFIFTADYSYYNYRDADKTIKNNYSLLDAKVYYQKKDSKWEYSLAATNLLNNHSINDDTFLELGGTITSQFMVQPRYFMFSVKYNL
ncbi:MAG: carboxypeptidase-like regulatory domain-containing protein [Flavobacteriaceae bacterium]|nr:carboxypeptidase-like regulatory domain-containing protein [Flavobacteriaceae bacterium]